jgi:hypothetical protein
MRKTFRFVALFVILLATTTLAFTQERITFKRGAKETVVTGNLTGYKSRKVFIVRVRRGQTLRTEQVKSNSSDRYVTVFIKAPNGETVGDSDASCNNRREISRTRAGDYRIEVVECPKADAWRGSFRLKVRVD